MKGKLIFELIYLLNIFFKAEFNGIILLINLAKLIIHINLPTILLAETLPKNILGAISPKIQTKVKEKIMATLIVYDSVRMKGKLKAEK